MLDPLTTAIDRTRTAIDRVREDVRTARRRDPAAKSTGQVLLYPGLHAVWAHRVSHRLDEAGHGIAARALSQTVRFLTGVEIHPAADLGRRVFIDHGMGVVIGETAELGDDVHLFHGVTLGGDDPRPVKRHPTVESEATLGANSTLVGDITVGEAATVGAGAVVVDDVPADATAVGNPAELVEASGDRTDGDVALVDESVPEGGEVAVEDAGTAGERATNGDTDDCDDRRFRLAC